MAQNDKSRLIDRNISVNFASSSQADQQLKARLQSLLDRDDRFPNKSDLGKHYLLKGLEAEEAGVVDAAKDTDTAFDGELLLRLKTIQDQLGELRRSDAQFESLVALVQDIDQRSRMLRPAFAEGIAMLLVQLDWDQNEAAAWAKKHLLRSTPGPTPPVDDS